jgi:hypothetical protein
METQVLLTLTNHREGKLISQWRGVAMRDGRAVSYTHQQTRGDLTIFFQEAGRTLDERLHRKSWKKGGD